MHVSVITHHKDNLQPKLGILNCLQDQYLKTASNVNIFSAQSSTIKILFKYVISIDQIGSLWWEIGATPILYRINKSSKPLLKINKPTSTKI